MTDKSFKSDDRVGPLNTILARRGGNLNDPIFKSSNARGGGGGFQASNRGQSGGGGWGFEASNRGQSSCRCTLDQWLDLIGVVTS